MTSAFSWQNSVSFCPASFCTPRTKLSITLHIPSYFCIPFPMMKRTSFGVCVSSRRSREASQMAPVVKNLPANVGDVRDLSLILGSGRSPRAGPGNPFQYSCLNNPTNRGAWRTTVHRVAESRTQLKQLACTHARRSCRFS